MGKMPTAICSQPTFFFFFYYQIPERESPVPAADNTLHFISPWVTRSCTKYLSADLHTAHRSLPGSGQSCIRSIINPVSKDKPHPRASLPAHGYVHTKPRTSILTGFKWKPQISLRATLLEECSENTSAMLLVLEKNKHISGWNCSSKKRNMSEIILEYENLWCGYWWIGVGGKGWCGTAQCTNTAT